MFAHSFAIPVILGLSLVLTHVDHVYACSSRGSVKEQQPDENTSSMARFVRKTGNLMDDNGGYILTERSLDAAESEPFEFLICGTPNRTKSEVRAFAAMVNQFYQGSQGSPGGVRRLQQTILVDVNFVVVKHTDGRGATEAQVLAQIEVLNGAFSPDFRFNLKTLQFVTNDDYFSNVDVDDGSQAVELRMKKAHKRGGLETLSVYAVEPVGNIGAWAYYPLSNMGTLDGVVMRYTGIANGGHPYFSQGKVSRKSSLSSLPAVHYSFSVGAALPRLVRCLYMKSGIGLAFLILSKMAVTLQGMV
jgi:hypothetical protein